MSGTTTPVRSPCYPVIEFTNSVPPTALGHDKAQSIIDQITAAYESGNPPPGGFGFGPQHLAPSGPPFGGPPMGYGAPPQFGGPPPFGTSPFYSMFSRAADTP